MNEYSIPRTDPFTAPQFAAYDGNGNVMALVHGGVSNPGTVTAQYEYGPFGELLNAAGTWATSNPFRFSTKYQDDETTELYYGYRFYNGSVGRWPSRDPIEERGGVNVYGFVENDPIVRIDLLGQTTDIDFTYFGLAQFEGQPCCDKPLAYELDAKHVSIAYSATPVPQSFLATGQAFVTNPDLKVSGFSPAYPSWWSCCKDAPNPLPVDGPLPNQGLQFDCPCADKAGEYVCIWRVRLHYLSCENFKWKLRVAEIGGSYSFLYTPKKEAWWQPKVGKGRQVYPP